jgi:Tfp pilus assembly protein PilX
MADEQLTLRRVSFTLSQASKLTATAQAAVRKSESEVNASQSSRKVPLAGQGKSYPPEISQLRFDTLHC